MPLTRAADEILGIDRHEAYRLAREGRIPGAFKVGKPWFVSTLKMIRGMQEEPTTEASGEGEADDFDGLLDEL